MGTLAVVLVSTLWAAQGAGAQESPELTVTPDTGLVDGQTVTVSATGFLPPSLGGASLAGLFQCTPDYLTSLDVFTDCNFGRGFRVVDIDEAGNVSEEFVVREVITSSVDETLAYDCALNNDCFILVQQPEPFPALDVTAPISFGPDVPETRTDCRNDGWRNLANDQGQPFRNEGRCVSYVVAHRH